MCAETDRSSVCVRAREKERERERENEKKQRKKEDKIKLKIRARENFLKDSNSYEIESNETAITYCTLACKCICLTVFFFGKF
jgi:hypothetical protein